jgi:putative ATPase
MKDLEYGKGYKYPHDYPDAVVEQQYLPDELKEAKFYKPGTVGFEKQLQKRLEYFVSRKSSGKKQG